MLHSEDLGLTLEDFETANDSVFGLIGDVTRYIYESQWRGNPQNLVRDARMKVDSLLKPVDHAAFNEAVLNLSPHVTIDSVPLASSRFSKSPSLQRLVPLLQAQVDDLEYRALHACAERNLQIANSRIDNYDSMHAGETIVDSAHALEAISFIAEHTADDLTSWRESADALFSVLPDLLKDFQEHVRCIFDAHEVDVNLAIPSYSLNEVLQSAADSCLLYAKIHGTDLESHPHALEAIAHVDCLQEDLGLLSPMFRLKVVEMELVGLQHAECSPDLMVEIRGRLAGDINLAKDEATQVGAQFFDPYYLQDVEELFNRVCNVS